jgi:hypothetical protein
MSLIASDFLIKTTLSITSSLIYNINYIRSIKFHDEDLRKIFIENDVLSDIGIIKTYIEEQQQKPTTSPSLKASIENLNETLGYLEQEINNLTTKIKTHHLKWFASYRSYGIEKEKQNILTLTQLMNHRFEMLMKVSCMIYKS